MKIVLATRNPGKITELRRILGQYRGSVPPGATGSAIIEVVGLEAFPDAPDVPETELTFAGNALLKARAIVAHTGLPAVSDDSGLCVDALNGMPGVLSARWSGRFGDGTPDKAGPIWNLSWTSSVTWRPSIEALTSVVWPHWCCPQGRSTWWRAGWTEGSSKPLGATAASVMTRSSWPRAIPGRVPN
jgi:Xanthosine triphosphate pyrophosphatase